MELSRHFIGEGWEHRAYLGKTHKDTVFKETKTMQNIYLHLAGFFERRTPQQLIRNDVSEAEKRVDSNYFIVARTRVVPLSRGSYIVTQPFIREDQSIPDIDEYAKEYGSQFIREKLYIQRQNFIISEGKIYWIDPTKGILTRFLTESHLLSWEQLTTLKYSYLRTIDRFKIALGIQQKS